jgi:hypothetical protein
MVKNIQQKSITKYEDRKGPIGYNHGGQPCRQSPNVANWPSKSGNLSDKRIVKFRIKFSIFLIESICFIISV